MGLLLPPRQPSTRFRRNKGSPAGRQLVARAGNLSPARLSAVQSWRPKRSKFKSTEGSRKLHGVSQRLKKRLEG